MALANMTQDQTNENKIERRYLDNWNYNAALIFDHLEKIVHDSGGMLVTDGGEWFANLPRKSYLIIRRGLARAVQEQRERVERLERISGKTATIAREELERLERIDNTPATSHYGDYRYIRFLLNGVCYYFGADKNPFFPFHYCKTPAENGTIERNTYHEEDNKDWLFDCFFRYDCSDADRTEAANMIFNNLMNARLCRKAPGLARPAKLFPLAGEMEVK